MSFTVTDPEGSDIKHAAISYKDPEGGGGYSMFHCWYRSSPFTCSGTVAVGDPPLGMSGVWTWNEFDVEDEWGNRAEYKADGTISYSGGTPAGTHSLVVPDLTLEID
jgi:hypothetical protein